MNKLVTPIQSHLLAELKTLPNQAGIHSLIEKKCVGDVFTNDPDRYVLLKTSDAYCYFAGELFDSDLYDLVCFLKTSED